jgi:hypothetical protein
MRIEIVFAIPVEDDVRTAIRRMNAINFFLSMSVLMALVV